EAQAAAAQQGVNAVQSQNVATQAQLSPYINTGTAALGGMADLLGLGGAGSPANYAAYVQGNPDLLAAYQRDGRGMGMDQWGQEHWNQYGQNEGRAVTPGERAADPAAGQQAQASAIEALRNSPLFRMLFDT